MRLLLCAVALALAAPPAPAAVTELVPFPARLELDGLDDAPQLVVTGRDGPRDRDVTGDATYAVSDPKVVRVTAGGRVVPLADGTAEVTVAFAGKSVKVPVAVRGTAATRPINFANTVEPIFTKLGCNSGGCHGKIQGQNGFRLSLLGFDPELDYATLVKESRGRRVFPAAPDESLFLLKSAGQVPHGGGKKTEVGSEEYKVLRRWVATGTPFGRPTDPTIVKVSVFPEARVVGRGGRQQLAVRAHFSDGTTEDVTRRAQYESNATEVATVGEAGLVTTLNTTGEAAVMVRFSGQVTVFRAAVPRPGATAEFAFEPKTVVDKFTAAKWRELNIAPSAGCTDDQFARRVSLDITGTLPSAAEMKAFAADTDPAKRDKLVDKLLDSPGYADTFALKWADILRVKRRGDAQRAPGTFRFHAWIRDAVAADLPYSEFARAVVGAVGDEVKSPPTVWFKEVSTPEQFADDVSQVFLGQRLACAQCHHHPYEKWTQDDYWGLAAFFGRVGKKDVTTPGRDPGNGNSRPIVVFTKAAGGVTNKRTGKSAAVTTLGGDALTPSADDDPRQLLADWMTDPKNPFFARAVANRYWAHFFGRGIVDPPDDMRVTNPPSNPELLDALAADLVANKFSLKALVRTICKSRTYQLSADPTPLNAGDTQSFARFYPRRLPAEVVFDAVCQVTLAPADFNGLPHDRHAPDRAVELPDESFASYFLDVLGRPQRISACECERTGEASLAMTLHLLNSQEVQDKIGKSGGRAEQLARDPRPDAEKVDELFLLAVGARPDAGQRELALAHLSRHTKDAKDKKLAWENVIWALLNSKAFLFNR